MYIHTGNRSTSTPPILIQNCSVRDRDRLLLQPFSWRMEAGQTWLVTGSSGSGKDALRDALAGNGSAVFALQDPDQSFCRNMFAESTVCVSFEGAAALIKEERDNDDSDYMPDGGAGHGRSVRTYLQTVLGKTAEGQEAAGQDLPSLPEVKLCGIAHILDRGIKYLSTGEIRRTLICRALLSRKRLLILSEPFAGLDSASRTILKNFFSMTPGTEIGKETGASLPNVIFFTERYAEIPGSVTHVLEFSRGKKLFCGSRSGYEQELRERADTTEAEQNAVREAVIRQAGRLKPQDMAEGKNDERRPLIEMHKVHVEWDGHTVLDNLDWILYEGEHWLIRGPNGSGKTTFLELISGDNMQVFCNDISLFGRRRGSGETVWEIKARMGIVSYRLHLEYRMVGDTDLESVVISGLKDTIGLYEPKTDMDIQTAARWLELGGFKNRQKESFASLSYGEQRALLILRAAVKCPPLLILDEPCHGLDQMQRARILTLLETIAEGGASTLLHVTHDPDEILICEKHILELDPCAQPMYKIIETE